MTTAIVQKWEESEHGWGVRPDGYSLHLTDADRLAYIESYWAGMPDSAPAEYSRPSGSQYEAEIGETEHAALLAAKTAGKRGVRMFNNNYPGSGGTDGWVKWKKPGAPLGAQP